MNEDLKEMEEELSCLVRLRNGLVGIDLKRVNYQIAELQNKIDHAERKRSNE